MPPAENSNALGTYLRARREQARPEAAGVPDQRNRRVPGLRREEVAFLAGVSSDYYVRLEQGRDKNPSEQVVLSIARALQLDEDATGYLLQLSQPASRRRKRPRKPEKVSDSIRDLIEGWPLTPAYVHGRYMDVLAANRLAAGLSPFLVPGRNAILDAFTEPEMRELHQDWEAAHPRHGHADPRHVPRRPRQRVTRAPPPARRHQRAGGSSELRRPGPQRSVSRAHPHQARRRRAPWQATCS
jgi:transcriptional regulator with XRE-family HTH domain